MEKKVRRKSNWIIALQFWNKKFNSGSFIIPKKGTVEYNKVKEIQAKLENQVSKKKGMKNNASVSVKKKRGRPKKQIGRGNDDEWVDTNVNIIGELEEAGVPVPTELSLVNTVYDTFGPKAPQVNKKTGKIRPAPGLFDFLNFEL